MIVAAALCPAAPLLIEGTAPALAVEQAGLVVAAARAVRSVSRAAERLLVLAPGRSARWIPSLPVELGTSPFGRGRRRETRPSAPSASLDPAGPAPADLPSELAAGIWVAGSLLAAASSDATEITALQLGAGGTMPDEIDIAELVGELRSSEQAVGVLVMADGAICHGDNAPAAPDPRAAAFEDSLQRALTVDPVLLGRWCAENEALADGLGASAPAALAVLAQLLADRQWLVEARDHGAPYGVGYHVASWRR